MDLPYERSLSPSRICSTASCAPSSRSTARCRNAGRSRSRPRLSPIPSCPCWSWIDENGSAPDVDLGTWIGEEEENRGWELLGEARDFLAQAGAAAQTAPAAFDALYLAEGSDWFWWFGEDQDSGNDDEFDDLFRTHLKNVYKGLLSEPPAILDRHIVPHAVLWTFTRQVPRMQPGDRLTIRTNCPGVLTWWLEDGEPQTTEMLPVGGVMAGVRRYRLTLGPFPAETGGVHFRFRCTHAGCNGQDICCRADEHRVEIIVPRA